MGAFRKEGGLVRTKRTWLFVASIALAVGGLNPAIFSLLYGLGGHAVGVLGFLLYYASFIGLMWAWNRWWREERGDLRADETGLVLGERRVIRRDAVRHGYVLEREGRTYVRLGRMLRLVDVEVADVAEGEAMLAAMRLDAARSVAEYPMAHGTWRGAWIRAALSVVPLFMAVPLAHVLGGQVPAFLGCLLGALFITLPYSVNQLVRVSVGADGLRIRRLLQRARFVPFSSIDEATTDGRDIAIRLRDGKTITMHHSAGRGWKPLAFADRALEASKLVERIEEQLSAHRARSTNADAPVFARAGRDTEAWLRDVVSASDANASYRTPAVPPDELWRIVEDAAAPATERAGAAVALRQALDEDGRVRLRAVADACAGPRLRVALETVAGGEDDEHLRGALDPLDDQEAPPRRALRAPQ